VLRDGDNAQAPPAAFPKTVSTLTALMGLYGQHSSSGLIAWSPRPTQKPAPPRWFFGGAGRTPQYLRHR